VRLRRRAADRARGRQSPLPPRLALLCAQFESNLNRQISSSRTADNKQIFAGV
jgi:hypothetical protein